MRRETWKKRERGEQRRVRQPVRKNGEGGNEEREWGGGGERKRSEVKTTK